jgi:hypothetical protein
MSPVNASGARSTHPHIAQFALRKRWGKSKRERGTRLLLLGHENPASYPPQEFVDVLSEYPSRSYELWNRFTIAWKPA